MLMSYECLRDDDIVLDVPLSQYLNIGSVGDLVL